MSAAYLVAKVIAACIIGLIITLIIFGDLGGDE